MSAFNEERVPVNDRPLLRTDGIASPTGLAPFMSIIRDPETAEESEQVILVHGVRGLPQHGAHHRAGRERQAHRRLRRRACLR